jgi:hypothetical protein
MQERGNRLLLVETAAAGESQNVDAAELVVRCFGDQPLDGGDAVSVR